MMRRAALIGMALLLVVPLVVLATNQHINMLPGKNVQIDGSNPSYIEHGTWDLCVNVPGPSPRSNQTDPSYSIPPIELALQIDDEFIESGPFIIYKRPEHTTPPIVDGDAWYFVWRYQFGANYFSNGTYRFDLQWLMDGVIVLEREIEVTVY